MEITKLYSELQLNPRSASVYRNLLEYYKNKNMLNEAKAFEELIKKKFNVNNSLTYEKQSKDDQVNS
jgi:hypothetical protein